MKVKPVHKAVDKCEIGLARLKRALTATLNSIPKTLKTGTKTNYTAQIALYSLFLCPSLVF